MATAHPTDVRARAARDSLSLFDQMVLPRTLNMVALVGAVLWLLAMLSAFTGVAGRLEDPAVWDYVAAADDATGFLVVSIVAWTGAAVVRALTGSSPES
ncbi:MAG: hypothetical protein ACE5GB_08405 [Acidimicrobiales bacterium]